MSATNERTPKGKRDTRRMPIDSASRTRAKTSPVRILPFTPRARPASAAPVIAPELQAAIDDLVYIHSQMTPEQWASIAILWAGTAVKLRRVVETENGGEQ